MAASVSERHLEVLRAALVLFGERGYAGASLRELARRLQMSQPSLYHYVDSKEQLVEQVITHLGAELLTMAPLSAMPSRLEDIPRFIVDLIFAVYRNPSYPGFVRFIFAVSTEKPQYRAAIRALYGGGFELGAKLVMAPHVASGAISEERARTIVRTASNGLGLLLIEEIVLGGKAAPSAAARAYGNDLAQLLEASLTQATSGRPRRR